MKIISISNKTLIEGKQVIQPMMRVLTDNQDPSEFVYPKNKFKTMKELRTEINKRIALDKKIKDKNIIFTNLKTEFNKEK